MSGSNRLDLSKLFVGSLSYGEHDPENWRSSSMSRALYKGNMDFYDLPPGTSSAEFEAAATQYYGAYCDAVAEHRELGWIRVELDDQPPTDNVDHEEFEDDDEEPIESPLSISIRQPPEQIH